MTAERDGITVGAQSLVTRHDPYPGDTSFDFHEEHVGLMRTPPTSLSIIGHFRELREIRA
jgi:hypothetical protein